MRTPRDGQRTCFSRAAEHNYQARLDVIGVSAANYCTGWNYNDVARMQLVGRAIENRAHTALLENHVLIEDGMTVLGDFGVRRDPKYLNYCARAFVHCGS